MNVLLIPVIAVLWAVACGFWTLGVEFWAAPEHPFDFIVGIAVLTVGFCAALGGVALL